jgi:hypothetical protein
VGESNNLPTLIQLFSFCEGRYNRFISSAESELGRRGYAVSNIAGIGIFSVLLDGHGAGGLGGTVENSGIGSETSEFGAETSKICVQNRIL